MSGDDRQKHQGHVVDEVLRGLKRIEYGEIIITIHDSRVVQVEKREKTRFSVRKHGDCTGRAQKE